MTHVFNWVDYAIIGIVLFSIVISFFRGFLREAVSLVTWISGILIALKFADSVQPYLTFVDSPMWQYIIAVILLFLIVFLFGMLVNIVLRLFVKTVGFGFMDRVLGVFFGIVRGVLITAVLLMFASAGSAKGDAVLKQSRLAPDFQPLVLWLDGFLPKQMHQFSSWISHNNEYDRGPS